MKVNRAKRPKRPRRNQRNQDEVVTDMLKVCLQKVCELQADIERTNEEEMQQSPEEAGYVACAMETLRFLSEQGLTADHPVIKRLSERLLGQR